MALTDCLLRHHSQAEWVIPYDFDEFLLLSDNKTFAHFVNRADKKSAQTS